MSPHVQRPPKRPRTHPPLPPPRPSSTRSLPPISHSLSHPSSPPALRSFVDLLPRSRSRAAALLNDNSDADAWADITATLDNLGATVVPVSHSSPPPDPVPSEAPVHTAGTLPCDHSIKKKLIITSATSLMWLRKDLCDATEKAFICYRYPAEELPRNVKEQWAFLVGSAGKKSWTERSEGDLVGFALRRLLKWQMALGAVYRKWRKADIERFWVVLPTTKVLFWRDNNQLSVCFAKATTGLRALLAEYCVTFQKTNGPHTRIVVHGEVEAHKVYNFLLGAGYRASNATDVPLVVADRSFKGCAMSVVDVAKARRMVSEDKLDRFSVELNGLFTPTQIEILCDVLKKRQGDKGFVLQMSGDGGGGLNDPQQNDSSVPMGEVLSRVEWIGEQTNGYTYTTREAG